MKTIMKCFARRNTGNRMLSLQRHQRQFLHHTSRASLAPSPSDSTISDANVHQPSPPPSQYQNQSGKPLNEDHSTSPEGGGSDKSVPPRRKTIAELDEELRLKLEGRSGEGGTAGVEYENGKSEGLKRGVKANMFRII